jgi:hypothetical protein
MWITIINFVELISPFLQAGSPPLLLVHHSTTPFSMDKSPLNYVLPLRLPSRIYIVPLLLTSHDYVTLTMTTPRRVVFDVRYVHSPLCRCVYWDCSSSFINRASTSNITCMHRYMATQKPTNQRLWRRETTTRLPYTIDGYGDLNQHQMFPKFIVRPSSQNFHLRPNTVWPNIPCI